VRCLPKGCAENVGDVFANPVVADVIESGRKIAGAAQRRTRGGLLHQGSIQRGGLRQAFAGKMTTRIERANLWKKKLGRAFVRGEFWRLKMYATEEWLHRLEPRGAALTLKASFYSGPMRVPFARRPARSVPASPLTRGPRRPRRCSRSWTK